MSRSLRIFSTEKEYKMFYNNIPYSTPFVSLIKSNGETHIDYKIPPPPLTFEIIKAGNVTAKITQGLSTGTFKWVEYSTDNGTTWHRTVNENVPQTKTITVSNLQPGDTVQWRADSTCIVTLTGSAADAGVGAYFAFTSNDSGVLYNVSGCILSLQYGEEYIPSTLVLRSDSFANTFRSLFYDNTLIVDCSKLILANTMQDKIYWGLFNGCRTLTSAPELPATTLAADCYRNMFYGCTSLTSAPELPATTLAADCYNSMFYGCTSLTSVPELPATTLAADCYRGMFQNCASLVTPPSILPAITLAADCCNGMFIGCTSLTSAPELPATTLAANCYYTMFYGCTSLTSAPELPATTLAANCYYGMFYTCRNLNNITMLATDISASNCLYNWVSGVASSGTFIKNVAMATLPSGTSGIPSGWRVVDYQAAS